MEPTGRHNKENENLRSRSTSRSSSSIPVQTPSPPPPTEKAVHAKVARILDACRWEDVELLRLLATSDEGLLTDELRRQAWPLLLGFPVPGATTPPEESIDWRALPKHGDEGQVRLDVDRSFIYYPHNQSARDLDRKKEELSDLITEVLRRHPYLCYFQGYHDICQVFLLVLDRTSRAAAVARLSTLRIRDFMLPTLAPALAQLSLIPDIIRASNPDLYYHLSGTQPFFALSGTLTMYAHDIQEYGDIARLFDVFLAREAVFSVYMFAQIVLQRSEELFETPADEPEMLHSILSKLPKPLNLEALIRNTVALFEKYPPERLQRWSLISRSSVLKTGRWPSHITEQTLEDGEAFFQKQVRELQWAERRDKAVAVAWKYRRPAGTLGLAVLVGVVSFWMRRSAWPSSLSTGLGALWRWYSGTQTSSSGIE
ncbi:GTPase-activating protein gyp10 [Phlyctema vagabunda]|uniref:GTPase-activating protein gyp10 n=1 Tax=Phlyctema vagabunda TaxID=108571 RepID=A0ABR4PYC5_9HELO